MPASRKVMFGECRLPGCRIRYRKKRRDQKFCCRKHKDLFYKVGHFPIEKLIDEITRLIRPELDALRVRLTALEAKTKEPADLLTRSAPLTLDGKLY